MVLAKTTVFLALSPLVPAGMPPAIAKDRKGQSSQLGYGSAHQADPARLAAIKDCSTNVGKIVIATFKPCG